MTKEQFSLYISNKIRRNKNRAERKWKTEQIEQLESVDNRLHGRLRNLKIEKEKLLNVGKQRLARFRADQAMRKVATEIVDAEVVPRANDKVVKAAPRGSKRVQEDNVNVACSKRCREQTEKQQATDPLAEYEEAKSTLDILLETCVAKLKKCTTPELPGLSNDVDAIRIALMNFTRKTADRMLHFKDKMLKEEETALRDVVAGYRLRYVTVKGDLDFKRDRVILPTDVHCWLSGFESQLKVIEQPLASKDFDVVISKCEKLIVDIEAKASDFEEEDIYMSLESEELTARYQTIVRKLHDKKKEYCDASFTVKKVDATCLKLEGFLEQQWELHDSPLASEKAADMIIITMGVKLVTLTSLSELSEKLDSFECLTDKEAQIKRIHDVRDNWNELMEVVKTAKADAEKKEGERKRTEVVQRTQALSTILDSFEHLNISQLPTNPSDIQKLTSQVLTWRDVLSNSEMLVDDLKFCVRGLPEPCSDADDIFARWRKCIDTVTSRQELYSYWKEVCLLFERQCLYIEKKSSLFSLLNTAPKAICVKISPILIQEVVVYLQEVDTYEDEAKFYQVEECVRESITATFKQHRRNIEETLSMLQSTVNKSEVNDVVEEPTLAEIGRIWDQVIYGDSPSLNVPFIPPTSSRRRAKTSVRGTLSQVAGQKPLQGVYQVFVSSAVNPALFYVQLVSNVKALEIMQHTLNTIELVSVEVKLHMECVAKFIDDGKLYRAEVVEVSPKGALVNFIDYGNMQLCQERDLRELPRTLRYPPFAFRCCLAGISPSRAWTDDDSSKFCSVNGTAVHEATFLKTVDGVSQIRLFYKDRLVNLEYGMPEYRNVPVPSTGFLVMPWTLPQICTVSSFRSAEELYLKPSQADEHTPKVEEHNAFYGTLLKTELLEDSDFQHGLPCVALEDKDNTFHRAMLFSDLTAAGEVKVFLVDEGFYKSAKKSNLRRIVPEFLTFPALLWKCQIAGVRSVLNEASWVGNLAYSNVIAKGELAVDCERVVLGVHHVKIHLSTTEDMASFLVNKGVVEYRR